MATMKFKNVLTPPTDGADDGMYFVKRGASFDIWMVSNGIAYPSSETMLHSYGIEIDTSKSSPLLQRIGNPLLHQSLPVQSKMRRCVLDDNGDVVYYLNANDSRLKEDGTEAKLDGTDGQVMVEVPDTWVSFLWHENIQRVLISDRPLPGFKLWAKNYISAYEATVYRPENKLSSVATLNPEYRGGSNNASRDEENNTQLGMPATAISLTNFRDYARNRGDDWQCNTYWSYKKMYWLYMVEYANLNSQSAFNAQPDANGYKQGGLGAGVTSVNSTKWSNFNGYYPIYRCGVTNELGNATGIVPTLAPEGFDGDGESVTTSQDVPSYRGIENPFGHIWKWTDGLLINIESDDDGGRSRLYVAKDTNYASTINDSYEEIGNMSRADGYVREIIFGVEGEILPKLSSGANTATYFCDNFYTSVPASGASLRGVLFGGYASYGAAAGLACVNSHYAPSATHAIFGSRLCFPK